MYLNFSHFAAIYLFDAVSGRPLGDGKPFQHNVIDLLFHSVFFPLKFEYLTIKRSTMKMNTIKRNTIKRKVIKRKTIESSPVILFTSS